MRRYRHNPEIELSPEHFHKIPQEYQEWALKWWREAIQNSVDAKATIIDCKVHDVTLPQFGPNPVKQVTIEDNGGGMDRHTLMTKFLKFSGTSKTADTGAVGGFGKAKELLILPWLAWEVITQNHRVYGVNTKYTEETLPTTLSGTRLTVFMSNDSGQHTTDLLAKSFIKKCYVPHVLFRVNGEEVTADLAVGEKIREFERARIYYDEQNRFSWPVILYRVNGLYMYSHEYVPSGFNGTLIIELLGPSTEILASNREKIFDRKLGSEIQSYLFELAKNVTSATRSKEGKFIKAYPGSLFSSDKKEEISQQMTQMVPIHETKATKKGTFITLDGNDTIKKIVEILAEAKKEEEAQKGEQPPVPVPLSMDPNLAEAMLSNVQINGPNHVQAAFHQMAWQPRFMIANEIKGFKVPAKFTPEQMTVNVKKLVRLWAELCRFVLIQLGCDREYGVGFIFDYNEFRQTYTAAECKFRYGGCSWFLLNPFKQGDPENPIYSLSSEDDLDRLYALAIHECTHLADQLDDHDEIFTSAFTRNVARTSRGRRNIRAIKRIVTGIVSAEPVVKPKAVSKGLQPGKGYYKVITGNKGSPPVFSTLQEARDYIDTNHPSRLCSIDAFYWPSDKESKKQAVKFITVEQRLGGKSLSPDDHDALASTRSLWAQDPSEMTLDDPEDIWRRRNPSSYPIKSAWWVWIDPTYGVEKGVVSGAPDSRGRIPLKVRRLRDDDGVGLPGFSSHVTEHFVVVPARILAPARTPEPEMSEDRKEEIAQQVRDLRIRILMEEKGLTLEQAEHWISSRDGRRNQSN